MTPKSLLRHPRSVSSLEDCSDAGFQPVITPANMASRERVKRAVLCSGKIFFDLESRRQELNAGEVSIIRIEQLYPFPKAQLQSAFGAYPRDTPLIWAQEEPENMGAWWYLSAAFAAHLPDRAITVIANPTAASPATGSATRHKQQQKTLINRVFAKSLKTDALDA
jgi:2-oxoglutarate dehydrogenase E1 component